MFDFYKDYLYFAGFSFNGQMGNQDLGETVAFAAEINTSFIHTGVLNPEIYHVQELLFNYD